jgi:hypothetical protein
MQAQIYDPPGKTAIRPQQAESDLALLETPGAARASFAEFAPFFDSDGMAADITATVGNNDTFGDEVSFTVLHGGFSLGIGQFHHETDGYARNNDVTHDIVSLQARAEVTPWLDLFGELRLRDTSSGDRWLKFDLDIQDPTTEIEDERWLARLGFHAELSANQDLAGVLSYVERDGFLSVTDYFTPDGSSGQITEQEENRESWEIQLQHVGRFGPLTTVSGVSYAESDLSRQTAVSLFFLPLVFPIDPTRRSSEIEHYGAYSYGTYRFEDTGLLSGSEVTLGLSLESYDDNLPEGRDSNEISPKAGARLRLGPATLRGAYTETVVPSKTLEQRLEPTTVAGFTQFTDHDEGSIVEQAAVGGDLQVTPWLSIGAEAAWRWIDTPVISDVDADTDEREFRGFVNATLNERIATAFEVSHERSKSDLAGDLSRFELTEIHGGISYFHPSGFFASAGLGYVWHEYDWMSGAIGARSGDDSFPIADAAIGYRLPNERGVISLEVQNAFDESFGFEDRPVLSLQTPTAEPRFAREFSVMGRARLRF